MTHKRKHYEKQDGKSPVHSKRFRLNNPDSSADLPTSSPSRIDPTYGQRGAFPGLDDFHDDNNLFYGPASDGIEYLRMVRSEAKTVPNLLVAPASPTLESRDSELYADYPQGYYSDGAYTAIPPLASNPSQTHTAGEQQEDKDPQEAYYASLFARFAKLTETLQSSPPRAAPDNTDIYYLDWRKSRLWRANILNTAPTMVLLAQLTQESVVCGLGVLGSLLTLANLKGKKGKNIGAWTWGLLGRCREVGQMGSEEVGVLRDLGKQGVWLLRRISAGEIIGGAEDALDADARGDEDEESGEDNEECVDDGADSADAVDADDGYSPCIDAITTATGSGQNRLLEAHPVATISDTDIAKAKQHLLDSLNNSQAQANTTDINPSHEDAIRDPTPTCPVTEVEVDVDGEGDGVAERADEKAMIHATLDMLVTIIGEFYGQRDLLDGRLLWDEMQ